MSDIVIEQPVVVEAALNYLVPNGEKPATYAYEPPAGVPLRSGVYRTQQVSVTNARVAPPPGGLSLDRNGFELHQHVSALTDFSDPAAIERIYYPESEALLKRATGAKRVVIFDHTLRDGRTSRADGVREPVKFIHNDQTFVSGPRRVRDHLPPHEAEELLKGRVAIVNLWRPVGWTAESSPLALCDSRS
ncbi:MAG TPA: CmcJ/NvfI family oxidoreductase, partial [Paraburkholderia sp.]|nr:CmcJ/NvfI family oxidoreductase [Paraburkholderia sp.]